MLRYKKIAKNIFNFFTNKSPLLISESFCRDILQEIPEWVSISINKNSTSNKNQSKELEILTQKNAFSLKITKNNEEHLFRLWQNQQLLTTVNSPHNSPLLEKYNFLIDHLIDFKILAFQVELNSKLRDTDFSSQEISQDEKALEWLKVSFKVLESAIIESLTNSQLLFQTLLFFGKNPKSNFLEIRIITFNLDIQYIFLTTGMLRIKIYNDKDKEFGNSQKTVLEGDFNFRKREMLDELTKIISALSVGIKFNN
jgi:hypothetical protein